MYENGSGKFEDDGKPVCGWDVASNGAGELLSFCTKLPSALSGSLFVVSSLVDLSRATDTMLMSLNGVGVVW